MDGRYAAAALLRELRDRHHLTQRELAQMADVPQPTIASIESGNREPSLSLLSRILEATGDVLRLEVTSASPFSALTAARHMRNVLRDGTEKTAIDDALLRRALSFRDVLQTVNANDFSSLVTEAPSLIGDCRWDAFLAATVEESCDQRGETPPRWVDDSRRFVAPAWYFLSNPVLHEWEENTAPAAFRRHGIFVAAEELASV